MRALRLCALSLACLVVIASMAAAAPEVDFSVDPAEITVGDIFRATVTITLPAQTQLDGPPDDADLGDAEVRSATRSTEELPDGARRVSVIYEATIWEVGESVLRAPPATWRAPDGTAGELERPERTVTVHSVLPPQPEDILPLREPHEMPLRAQHYALAALPLLLLAGLIALAVIWYRRRSSEPASAETVAAPLGPAEEALAALDALEQRDLVGHDLLKEHYVEISQILRRYIERRWRLTALEETTGMLEQSMRASGRVRAEVAEQISGVLRRADLAKFAKHRPADSEARADVDAVREIVRITGAGEEAQGSGPSRSAAIS